MLPKSWRWQRRVQRFTIHSQRAAHKGQPFAVKVALDLHLPMFGLGLIERFGDIVYRPGGHPGAARDAP